MTLLVAMIFFRFGSPGMEGSDHQIGLVVLGSIIPATT